MSNNPYPTDTDAAAAKAKRRKSLWKEVREWAFSLFVALLATLFITQVLLLNAKVPSGSMIPTIYPDDQVIGLRTAYWFSDPERYDVIIFHYPDNEEELFVKRVIGLPGDRVEIRDGKIYINDSLAPLAEPYLREEPTGNFGPYLVPADSYFVMGDNRANSWDSRNWTNTFVHRDKILGQAMLRILPSLALIE